ncbi:hypothetical protein Vretifemale_9484, partial [Volvox reticuliferus]
VGIYGLETGRLKFLRDHCADVNIITRKAAQQLRLPLVASKTTLSTSSNPEVSTQEEVDSRGIQLILLPGTQHATALNLTQTLVVDNTPLFDFLVGNEQMHAVADSITQYPTAQLHFLPNLLENPGYVVTIPMSSIKHPAHATAAAFLRTACITSSSVQGSAPITKLGGGCTVKKTPCSAVTSAGDLAKQTSGSGLWALDALITAAAPSEDLKLEPAKPRRWTSKRKKFMPTPPPGARVYQPKWTWKAPMAMALLALLLLQLGVASYVGRQGRRHRFAITYEDGEVELMGVTELRNRLASVPTVKKAAQSTAAGEPAILSWRLESVEELEQTLGEGMPGWHHQSKVQALRTALKQPRLEECQPSLDEVKKLCKVVLVEKARRILLPFRWENEIRQALHDEGCSVRQISGEPKPAAVSPKVLLQEGGPCTEAVVFGASSELLDLLMPSTMQQIGLLMAVCAPMRYITEGDEARINWLRKRQLEGRLALSPAGQKVWIMLFATVALKEALLRPVEEMWELI